MGTFPGGAKDNQLYFGAGVRFSAPIPEEMKMLLFDPQTSGGLLLAVPGSRKEAFLKRSRDIDLQVWAIGEAVEGEGINVV
jgi:selenide,water dikinase